MMSKLINSNDYHLFMSISKVLHQVEWVQETENRWFLHFNYDFFLEIMFLLMVSVYNFRTFSNHQTLTPICPFPSPGSQEVSLGRPRNVYSASGTGAHLPGDPS